MCTRAHKRVHTTNNVGLLKQNAFSNRSEVSDRTTILSSISKVNHNPLNFAFLLYIEREGREASTSLDSCEK